MKVDQVQKNVVWRKLIGDSSRDENKEKYLEFVTECRDL